MKNVTALNNIIQGGRYAIEYTEPSSGSGNRLNYNDIFTTDPSRFIKMNGGNISYSSFRGLGYEANGLNLMRPTSLPTRQVGISTSRQAACWPTGVW